MRISDWSSDVCSSDLIVADLIIGFKMFRERFTSRVYPDAAARRIDVTYAEGPFKYLENHWVFEDHPQGCLIDFYVDFEFRSKLLQKRSEEHTSELQSLMSNSYAVFCLKKKKQN